jgi:hypothetical protein
MRNIRSGVWMPAPMAAMRLDLSGPDSFEPFGIFNQYIWYAARSVQTNRRRAALGVRHAGSACGRGAGRRGAGRRVPSHGVHGHFIADRLFSLGGAHQNDILF